MAAIAYVTDEKMIEFHRFNGSHSIVFWRLSVKKFQDFKKGDLLFFLAKDRETKQSKEKGLMGYGCLQDIQVMSLNQMWKKYGNKTGYNTKKELLEVVERSNKSKELPKKITCLLLDKVCFFQSPIYLSELGYHINNNLESFTYLDRHEGKLTLDILQQVGKIGLDLWSSALSENNEQTFFQQLIQYKLSVMLDSLDIKFTVDKKYRESVVNKFFGADSLWINSQQFCFLNGKELYIIFQTNHYQLRGNFYKLLGQLVTLNLHIKNNIEEKIKIIVLTNKKFSEQQADVLSEFDFDYIYCDGE
ncbi:MAG: hypothetical protein Q4C64_04485 [Erysipelotrichia bacterium]|nr:hypothetical protein [Erysipelotrichia bacterium]